MTSTSSRFSDDENTNVTASNNKFNRQITNQVEPKHCWVCFASEDDDYNAQWASPCKCRGTAKWVHKSCLQRWIDEKQQGNSTIEVACPQCNSVYIIVYPKSGIFVKVLDMLDRIICKSCPFIAGGVLVGSIYWTAVTYGAVTIMQVLGHTEGLNVMEKTDPLIMLVGLPSIPLMLMFGRLIRWEDAVLKFWRKHSTKLPLLNLIFPNNNNQYLPRTPTVSYSSNSDPVSFTRTICGGLILPTIATIFGKLLFQRVQSNFQRSIIGGIAFIGLKGIFKIYYKQQQFLRQAHRQIKNYQSSNNSASASTSSTSISTTSGSSSNNNNTAINNSTQTLTNYLNRRSRNVNNSNNASNSNTNNNNNNNNETDSNYLSNLTYSTMYCTAASSSVIPTSTTSDNLNNDSNNYNYSELNVVSSAPAASSMPTTIKTQTSCLDVPCNLNLNNNNAIDNKNTNSQIVGTSQSFILNDNLQEEKSLSPKVKSEYSSTGSSFESKMTILKQSNEDDAPVNVLNMLDNIMSSIQNTGENENLSFTDSSKNEEDENDRNQ